MYCSVCKTAVSACTAVAYGKCRSALLGACIHPGQLLHLTHAVFVMQRLQQPAEGMVLSHELHLIWNTTLNLNSAIGHSLRHSPTHPLCHPCPPPSTPPSKPSCSRPTTSCWARVGPPIDRMSLQQQRGLVLARQVLDLVRRARLPRSLRRWQVCSCISVEMHIAPFVSHACLCAHEGNVQCAATPHSTLQHHTCHIQAAPVSIACSLLLLIPAVEKAKAGCMCRGCMGGATSSPDAATHARHPATAAAEVVAVILA